MIKESKRGQTNIHYFEDHKKKIRRALDSSRKPLLDSDTNDTVRIERQEEAGLGEETVEKREIREDIEDGLKVIFWYWEETTMMRETSQEHLDEEKMESFCTPAMNDVDSLSEFVFICTCLACPSNNYFLTFM